jgi:hypothetical protein
MVHPTEPLIDLTSHQSDELGHRFTQKGAARACGVALNTIKRRRAAGAFPNAISDDNGVWRIPLADLLAAGLNPGHPTDPEPAPEATDTATDLEVRLAVTQVQLVERERAHTAEQAAAQREADALRAQLRQIEAARDQAADHTAQIRSQTRDALKQAHTEAENMRATITGLWAAVAALTALTTAAVVTVLALTIR